MGTKKPVLAGLLPQEIGGILKNCADTGLPEFRYKQVCQWIIRGATGFAEMKTLPLVLREELEGICRVYSSRVTEKLEDKDGTVKLRICLDDSNCIETVILNDGKNRKTACLSTQAGCPLSCVFCKTGTLGFIRNLKYYEITEQFLFLKKLSPGISNIVIMGMGEPLLNPDELRRAVGFFTDKEGMGLSRKRITISTAGIIDGIRDWADHGQEIRLALSLNSARQFIRAKLMPAAIGNPLPALKESLLYFQKKINHRITLEMVLLKGINTSAEEADAVRKFAENLDVMVNLIPWNPVEGLTLDGDALQPAAEKETAGFAAALENRRLKVTLRMSKGQGVSGACGQLGYLQKH